MAKNKQKTFAQRAREIQNKYKRANTDPLEAADMEAELQALMAEQEAVRESMGLTQPQEGMPQEFKDGGKMYPGGGSILPSDFAIKSAVDINRLFSPIPSEFETRSAAALAPIYRANQNNLPLSTNLSGISPGQTDVNVFGTGNSLLNSIPTGQIYNDTTSNNLNKIRPKRIDYKGLAYANQASNQAAKDDIVNDVLNPSDPFAPRVDKLSDFYNPPKTVNNSERAGYDLQSVYDYTNSLYPQGNQNQPLSPQQLAGMGQPWQRPNQQSSVGQAQGTNRVGVPQVNQSGVNRNPLLTDTTKMGMRVGDRVFTRPGENMGARVGGVFASGIRNPNINVGASIPAQNLETNKINAFGQSQVNKAGEMAEESWWDKNKQYAPYALSGLSNIASNLLLANMAKKNQPRMSAAMATPERINLEPQAEALRGQAGVAKNVAAANARNLGLNPMQAMASMSAAGTDVDRNLGDALTNLYMQQEGANVGAANQFNLANAQSQNRANMMNAQLDQQASENRLGYIGAALGTLPGVMNDIRMDRADQDMRDVMRSYYESMGRNYMVEGDIFEKDGFRYKVRNNKLEKVGKVK